MEILDIRSYSETGLDTRASPTLTVDQSHNAGDRMAFINNLVTSK